MTKSDNILRIKSHAQQWQALWQGKLSVVQVGHGGVVSAPDKEEGDGATPAGLFALRQVFYRPDRLTKPETGLLVKEISKSSGWCDDPGHEKYNQYVRLPFKGSHECLWRTDHAYDLLVTLSHNENPAIPRKGSAVFLHLAHDNFRSTAGCVAFRKRDLLAILKEAGPETMVRIYAG